MTNKESKTPRQSSTAATTTGTPRANRHPLKSREPLMTSRSTRVDIRDKHHERITYHHAPHASRRHSGFLWDPRLTGTISFFVGPPACITGSLRFPRLRQVLPLFTEVRGRGILRTSPVRSSRKLSGSWPSGSFERLRACAQQQQIL